MPPCKQERRGIVKKVIALAVAVVLLGLCAVPVTAQTLKLSPASVEVDVLAGGSSQVEFYVIDYSGEIEISLQGIPLTVEPVTVSVDATDEARMVVLTIHGDDKLGTETYQGFIRFRTRGAGMVDMAVEARATVNHIGEDAAFPTIPVVIGAAAAAAVAAAVIIMRRRRSRQSPG